MTVTNSVDAPAGMQKYQRLVARASLIGTPDYETFADQTEGISHVGLTFELYPFHLETVINRLAEQITLHAADPTFYTLFKKIYLDVNQGHPVFGMDNWRSRKNTREWDASIPLVHAIEKILKYNKVAHFQLPSIRLADKIVFFFLACQNMSMEPPVFWMVEKHTQSLPEVMEKFVKQCHKLASYTPSV